ncbi:tryptophan-rich sensory protein [Heliorestis convoluta]|uniref:Tryptophan-rich sensory protein n=1 Tax=Heliorestis convoluta TaxID=356322 RepID=A0A5Q2N402_9FIRM|nr:tryptophan-rich sensory protein [Heliorestis convoluta]QGG48032.1 tryptophan-rich sensory protein [Heliorestis convoluta]
MSKWPASLWALLNLMGFIIMVSVNYLANALPIGGRTTGEVSALYPVLVTPASYAFSIWGLIYLLLAGFVILQLIPRWRNDKILECIGPWFFLSCLFNALWILLWHYLYVISATLIIVALLTTLFLIYRRMNAYAQEVQQFLGIERLLVHLPFRIYLAWVAAATLINMNVLFSVFTSGHWGMGELFLAIMTLVIALFLALYFGNRYGDIAFMLVIIWALIAIGVNQKDNSLISAIAFAFAAFLALMSLIIFRQRRR